MINEDCAIEVIEFLDKYPSPPIKVASTMRDGYVTCIEPIKTICGAELYCSPKTEGALRKLLNR